MSAALKPQATELPKGTLHSRAVAPRRRLRVMLGVSQPIPFSRRTPESYPAWLKVLIVSQRFSLGVTLVAIAGTLAVYGLTVNANRRLAAATTRLEALEDQQNQLTTANTVFKNHLAQTALSQLGEENLNPKHVLFLEAAPVIAPPSPPADTAAPAAPKRIFPQGY